MKYYRLRHLNGLAAQITNTTVIQMANIIGLPVSTSQITSGAVLGTGAATSIKGVRWDVGTRVFSVWFITMPVTAIVSALAYWLIINGIEFFGL